MQVGQSSIETRPVRADAVRFIGPVLGRYTLPSLRDGEAAQISPCRIQSISAFQVALIAPTRGSEGEEVAARFEAFGLLKGRIARLIEDGFIMEIDATDEERKALARRVAWYKKKVHLALPDRRQNVRFPPREPVTQLVIHRGAPLRCRIIDVSATGVAVAADYTPRMGEPVAVGIVLGRVVRLFDDGFAIHFTDEQDPGQIEDLLAAYLPV